MPGLVPGIHVLFSVHASEERMAGTKPGHDNMNKKPGTRPGFEINDLVRSVFGEPGTAELVADAGAYTVDAKILRR
jgi:hypothetical protein